MITALLLLHLLALVQAANWNTDVRILATERLDPIISPNGVASHMHSIIGGSAFGAAYNQPDSMNSKCTSFPISVDKSNYWHPKPYWINNNGTSFTPLPISNRVYYIREKNSPNDWIRPFPEGLRMIVGSPFNKAPDSRSFQYLCRVADKFNGPGDIWSDHWNFERDCPRGILVSAVGRPDRMPALTPGPAQVPTLLGWCQSVQIGPIAHGVSPVGSSLRSMPCLPPHSSPWYHARGVHPDLPLGTGRDDQGQAGMGQRGHDRIRHPRGLYQWVRSHVKQELSCDA